MASSVYGSSCLLCVKRNQILKMPRRNTSRRIQGHFPSRQIGQKRIFIFRRTYVSPLLLGHDHNVDWCCCSGLAWDRCWDCSGRLCYRPMNRPNECINGNWCWNTQPGKCESTKFNHILCNSMDWNISCFALFYVQQLKGVKQQQQKQWKQQTIEPISCLKTFSFPNTTFLRRRSATGRSGLLACWTKSCMKLRLHWLMLPNSSLTTAFEGARDVNYLLWAFQSSQQEVHLLPMK